jgi:hypothetical protein
MRVLLLLLLTAEYFALKSHFIGRTQGTPPGIGHLVQRHVSFMDSDPTAIRPLYSSYGGDEGGGSLKNLGVIIFLGLGVFGTGFVSTLSGIGKDVAIEAKRSAAYSVQQSTQKNGASTLSPSSSSSSSSSRGTLTKLSRREINAKLAQVPVFFVKNANGGVYVADGQGKLFETRAGAEAFSSKVGGDSEIGAATMDEVYYPLIKKSQKLSVSGPIAANSEAGASYVLVGDPAEVEKAGGDTFLSKRPAGDFPLTRVPKLAFNTDGGSGSSSSGIQFPLFTERASAEGAYARLKDSTQRDEKDAKEDVAAALFQVAGMLDIVELWSTGGSEGRTLEIYPSMTEIENYKSLR